MSAMLYLSLLSRPRQLLMEKHVKDALEKKIEREKRRYLETSLTSTESDWSGPEWSEESDIEEVDDDNLSDSSSSAISTYIADHLHYELPFADGFPEEPSTSIPSHQARSRFLSSAISTYIVDSLHYELPFADGFPEEPTVSIPSLLARSQFLSSAISTYTVDSLHYELPFADGFPEEPTTSIPSHRARSQFLSILRCSPVIRRVVFYSSASALVNLYSALGEPRPTWIEGQITPLRDIFTQTEMGRLLRLRRKGNSLVIMGKDLHLMEERLREPEKFYANPNRPTKFRVWMILIHRGYNPNFNRRFGGPMSPRQVPGSWVPGPKRVVDPMHVPMRSLKWNSDPAVHAEWYRRDFVRTEPLRFSLALPTEVSTTGFMWELDENGNHPLLHYIDVFRCPSIIQIGRFQDLGYFPDTMGIFGQCNHWLVVRLGESSKPMGDINAAIPIFPCCERPECRIGWIRRRWECCPCPRPH